MAEKLSNVSEMIDTAVGKSRRLKEGILKAEWEKIVGKICEKCQPDYIKEGVLYIRAESPLFIHHLTLEKSKYIERINSYFDEEVVRDIVVRTGNLDENRDEYLNRESEDEGIENPEPHIKKEEVLEELQSSDIQRRNLGIMEKIAYLQKIAKEREEYLLSHGYKKCKVCGMLYEGEEAFCRVCIDNGKAKEYLRRLGKYIDNKEAEESEE